MIPFPMSKVLRKKKKFPVKKKKKAKSRQKHTLPSSPFAKRTKIALRLLCQRTSKAITL
jgi:hypothetical protein